MSGPHSASLTQGEHTTESHAGGAPLRKGGALPLDGAEGKVDAAEPSVAGGQPPVGAVEDPHPRDAELAEARRQAD